MMVLHLLVLLLSFGIQAGAQMKLNPDTLTVLRGEEARFTCSASNSKWTAMVWLLNGTAAVTISKVYGVLPSLINNVTAEEVSGSKGDSWVFVLNSTERYNQGQVTCDLQGIDRRTANLFVQEKGIVKVSGDDKLAFKGKSVIFECQAAGWYPVPSLYWLVNDKEVSQGEYNISSEESGKSLFTVSSNLSVMAAKSSEVDCLVSVSALTTPLKSSVRLTLQRWCRKLMTARSCWQRLPPSLLFCCSSCSASALSSATDRGDKQIQAQRTLHGSSNRWLGENWLLRRPRGRITWDTLMRVPQVPDIVYSSNPSLHIEIQGQASPSEENPVNIRRITTV
ncbi:immunoglobulin superfamily member 5 isoform X5 [Limanda limanda]|uniref:immunoglobulin superfamily member 5 isoform X5 n=1 Tax=Limanda limanda TaxID=27771 RepID=UPI0029C96B3C|nr:immunoglobulin superfamily member 5 isoform X5 [Limanda limanda]